jgi:hypothetical protein
MFCIKKPNKKIIPYLTSAIINNASSKVNKLTNINKNNEYCSLKQYYHLKTPSLLNAQGPSSTPITSTNGCTNCTNCSTLNSTSTNTTKIFFKPNKEDKNLLMKYFSQHSILKNIVHNSHMNNNKNNNLNENKNINKNQKKIYKYKNLIDINKNSNTNKNNNICRNNNIDNNNNLNHKKAASNKALQSSKNKNMDYNNKILNKCKTNELQNILKSNVKYLHKILTERNINPGSFNSSVNNNGSKIYENDSGNNNDIKDVNKILMKNKLNKKKEQNKVNKNSFC